jgi:hypothetical protein
MHKLSAPKRHFLIRNFFIFLLCTFITAMPARTASADAAPPPDPTVGGVGPYQPQKTNVQMMSETVIIQVMESPSNPQEPKQIRVDASFSMRNQGQAQEQMQVVFPLTRLNTGGSEEALYLIDVSSFTARVNGQSVPFTTITTPPEVTITDPEHGFGPDVQWAAFEAAFPVQQDVVLQVEYEMLNPYEQEGFTGIAYLLETGAGWYGNILSAEITLRLPYPITEEAVSANPGYVISGNEMHWTLKDFEPARKDNLEISTINADFWQLILRLRARVEKDPDDVDAWSELGDIYMLRAVFIRDGYFLGSSPHFTELTMQARQKAVDLRPDWGEAHYKLAEILWLGNPAVQNKLGMGGKATAPGPSLEDPAVQQALNELKLAKSFGIQESLPYFSKVFPELVLTVTPTPTAAIVPPTATRAPTATSTMQPPVIPTSLPAVSPTPTPNPAPPSSPNYANVLLIATLGGLTAVGAIIFLLKSKRSGAK